MRRKATAAEIRIREEEADSDISHFIGAGQIAPGKLALSSRNSPVYNEGTSTPRQLNRHCRPKLSARCPECSLSFVVNMNGNNNTEMKVREMRTTTIDDLRPTGGFAIRNAAKVKVDFNPGRIAVLPVHIVATREYLRHLRAAEMRDWEASGGDYLVSE